MLHYLVFSVFIALVYSDCQTCPDGYSRRPGTDSCYKIETAQQTWQQAQDTCGAAGGKLIEFDSAGERDFIIANLNPNSRFWIGGRSDTTAPHAASFSWSSDSSPIDLAFTQWAASEPNDLIEEDCIELYSGSGLMNDQSCGDQILSVCEFTLTDDSCPESWLYFGDTGSCYKGFTTSVNAIAAQAACVNLGTNLVAINSRAENDFVGQTVQGDVSISQAWIGAKQNPDAIEASSGWEWYSQEAWSFENWAPGEPNESGPEACGHFWQSDDTNNVYVWNDLSCTQQTRAYICEKVCKCPIASQTEALYPPVFNYQETGFSGPLGDLTLVWEYPEVIGRDINTGSVSFLAADGTSSGNSACTTALTDVTNLVMGSCNNRQSLKMAWDTLVNTCGWSQVNANSNDDDFLRTFRGVVRIEVDEIFTSDRGQSKTRENSWDYVVEIEIPRFAVMSTDITAFAAIEVDVALIQQSVEIVNNVAVGSIDFETIVGWPFKIVATQSPIAVTSMPTAATTTTLTQLTSIGQATGDNTVSTDVFHLEIAINQAACELDGTFTIDTQLELECVAPSNLCPSPSDTTPTIVLVVDTADFCGQVADQVEITAALTVGKEAYIIDGDETSQKAEFTASVTSEDIDITSIDCDRVTLTTDSSVIQPQNTFETVDTLVLTTAPNQGYYNLNFGSSSSITTSTGSGAQQTFSFIFQEQGWEIPRDTDVVVTVEARCELTFQGDNKKRAILSSQQQVGGKRDKSATVDFVVSAETTTDSSSSLVIAIWALVAFVALLF